MINLGSYGKAIIAIAFATLGFIGTALDAVGPGAGLGDLSLQTWLTGVVAIIASGGVTALVENNAHAAKIKMWLASAGALLTSLIAALDDHVVTQSEIITAVSAAVLATGFVYQTKGPAVTATASA